MIYKEEVIMNYFTERAVYYWFLLNEIADADKKLWTYLSGLFAVDKKESAAYGALLGNEILAEISSVEDAETYKNYLDGYCRDGKEFGKSERERAIIETKSLALCKIAEIFGAGTSKTSRLQMLSLNYGRDTCASVLFALRLAYLSVDAELSKHAEGILTKEFRSSANCDAGLILLGLGKEGAEEIAAELMGAPEMLLRPDALKVLSARFGGGGRFRGKRGIGF